MIDESKPLLLFGGPYSNLQATTEMRTEAERRGIPAGNVICTGDVVAYAAQPEATTQLIRDWGVQVVAGNCEEQLGLGEADCGCGFEEGSACDLLSRGWYPFALDKTSADSRGWMRTLPTRLNLTYAGLKLSVFHAGVEQNNRFLFASQKAELEAEFQAAHQAEACDVVITGHCGIPFIAPLSAGTWINAGVIGMPANDGTTDGWYAVLEMDAAGVRIGLHRLSYDHVSAAADMRRSGHANGYARTLITGIWPSHDVLPPAELAATGVPLAETTVQLPFRAETRAA